MSGIKLCSNCGKYNFEDAKFCENCGQELISEQINGIKIGINDTVSAKEKPIVTAANLNPANKDFVRDFDFTNPVKQDTGSISEYSRTGNLNSNGSKKSFPKWIFVILAALVVIVMLLLFIRFRAGLNLNSKSEVALSDHLGDAGDEVEQILHELKFNKISAAFYEGNDAAVTLNERGNIDQISILSPDYSFYDIKVGDEFDLDDEGRKLTGKGYECISISDEEIAYGNPENNGRLILFGLDGDKISSIQYYAAGAADYRNRISEYLSEVVENSVDIVQETEDAFVSSENNVSGNEADELVGDWYGTRGFKATVTKTESGYEMSIDTGNSDSYLLIGSITDGVVSSDFFYKKETEAEPIIREDPWFYSCDEDKFDAQNDKTEYEYFIYTLAPVWGYAGDEPYSVSGKYIYLAVSDLPLSGSISVPIETAAEHNNNTTGTGSAMEYGQPYGKVTVQGLIADDIITRFNDEIKVYVNNNIDTAVFNKDIYILPSNITKGDVATEAVLVAKWLSDKTGKEWSRWLPNQIANLYEEYKDEIFGSEGDDSFAFETIYATYYVCKSLGEKNLTATEKRFFSAAQPIITEIHNIIRTAVPNDGDSSVTTGTYKSSDGTTLVIKGISDDKEILYADMAGEGPYGGYLINDIEFRRNLDGSYKWQEESSIYTQLKISGDSIQWYEYDTGWDKNTTLKKTSDDISPLTD